MTQTDTKALEPWEGFAKRKHEEAKARYSATKDANKTGAACPACGAELVLAGLGMSNAVCSTENVTCPACDWSASIVTEVHWL